MLLKKHYSILLGSIVMFVLIGVVFYYFTHRSHTSSLHNITFSGNVIQGQLYEKQINNSLFFRLIPDDFGWTISVSTTTAYQIDDPNFASVVTPPYHGPNALSIEGWNFTDKTSLPDIRDFNFVFTDNDYNTAINSLQKMLWGYSYTTQEIDDATMLHDSLPTGHGTVTITSLQLGSPDKENQSPITTMKFSVSIQPH